MFNLDFQTITELKIVGKSFSILYFNLNFFIIFSAKFKWPNLGCCLSVSAAYMLVFKVRHILHLCHGLA